MIVNKLSSYITPTTTGYTALAGLGLTTVSGIVKTKSLKKHHKTFAWLTAGITLLHVGQIEYYKHKYRNE